jgi:hypothetical protein
MLRFIHALLRQSGRRFVFVIRRHVRHMVSGLTDRIARVAPGARFGDIGFR